MTGISELGLITFRVPGLYSPKSKFASINNPLSIIEPTFNESKRSKHYILQEASLLYSPMQGDLDFNYVTAISILLQATNNLVEDDDKPLLYQDLFGALLALKNKIDPYLVSLKFLISLMNKTGYELNVNGCIRCGGKKSIVAFSFLEGGFICEECANEETEKDLNKEQMILLRAIFNSRSYALIESSFSKEDALVLLHKFIEFMQEGFGYRLKNTRLILD